MQDEQRTLDGNKQYSIKTITEAVSTSSMDDQGTHATEDSSDYSDGKEVESSPPFQNIKSNEREYMGQPDSEATTVQSRYASKFLCCVNEEDFCKRGIVYSQPLPTACSACVSMWTEKTRQRFERNIDSLLSTDDNRGIAADDPGGDDSSFTHNFENRYTVMVKAGLSSLREDLKNDTEAMNDSSPKHRRGDLGFPRHRDTRVRWLRSKMSPHGDRSDGVERSMRRAQSFDDHVLLSQRNFKSGAKSLHGLSSTGHERSHEKTQNFSDLSHAFQSACECGGGEKMLSGDGMMHYGDRSLLESDDEDLGYDSDPEFFQKGNPSGILAPNLSSDSVEEEEEGSDLMSDMIDFNDIDRASQLIEVSVLRIRLILYCTFLLTRNI